MPPFTRPKFLSLSPRLQHKHAATILQKATLDKRLLKDYLLIAEWMDLPLVDTDFEALSNRYHFHLREAGLTLREENFLSEATHLDTLSSAPFKPIDIYLDSLRSMHNVGSIFRTTEAFRLGTIHLSANMPTISHEKLRKSAMGTEEIVPSISGSHLEQLRRPLIAIETTRDAISLYDYRFPNSFSLLMGNEEYGLSKEALNKADITLKIPLRGAKNSLNVATAFAIVAYEVSR